jgi:hypothetical protein
MIISTDSEDNFPEARFDLSYSLRYDKNIFNWSVSGVHCEKLQGDASDRYYFRVLLKNDTVKNKYSVT